MPGTPTILIIWGDDIGITNLLCSSAGLMGYRTPNIDRIGQEGAMFTDYYAEQGCPAGRNAFFTGMHPLRTGMIPPQLPGSPSYLRPGTPAIAKVHAREEAFASLTHPELAPDLIIGYNRGYRISWDGASGMASGPVFEDNTKAWSGDHGIDPRLVPGVFFCNRPIEDEEPSLLDLAPTALALFGLEPPKHMEGAPLSFTEASAGA